MVEKVHFALLYPHIQCCITSGVAAQLCAPLKMVAGGTLMVIYKKSYVMLHLEAEWRSKQNTLNANTILAEPGP